MPIAHNFWNVVHLLVEQMEQTGNKTSFYTDFNPNETEDESKKRTDNVFNRNDNNIGIPLMFNFYHGLELFMKGLLEVEGIPLPVNSGHNLQELYKTIKENEKNYSHSLIELLKKHIYNSSDFNPFFESNDIKPNQFYLGLKYPYDKESGKKYNYSKIRGGEEETLKIYQSLRNATIEFVNELKKWRNSNVK